MLLNFFIRTLLIFIKLYRTISCFHQIQKYLAQLFNVSSQLYSLRYFHYDLVNEVLLANERQSREIEQNEQILFWLWNAKFDARTNHKFNINWRQFSCFVFRSRWKKYYFVRESFFDFWFFCCCSCCYCCVWCWCWFWFFDSSFRSRFSISFSISHDSKSYDRECSSWTRV